MNNRRIKAALLGLAVVLVAAGCAETKADQAGVHYDGGPLEGAKFNRVIAPGSGQTATGIDDDVYFYPTTTRDYTASDNAADGPETGAIECPVEGTSTKWTVVVFFKVNVSRLRGFHENVAMKYKADDSHTDNPRGWNDMLNKQVLPHLADSVQRVCRSQKLDAIIKDPAVYGKLSGEVGAGLKAKVSEAMSGEYLCGPGFNGPVAENNTETPCPEFQVAVKNVTIQNPNVLASYDAQKVAANENAAASLRGDARITEAQKQKQAADELASLYQNPNYIAYLDAQARLECAKNPNGKCVQINDASNGGASVNVTPDR